MKKIFLLMLVVLAALAGRGQGVPFSSLTTISSAQNTDSMKFVAILKNNATWLNRTVYGVDITRRSVKYSDTAAMLAPYALEFNYYTSYQIDSLLDAHLILTTDSSATGLATYNGSTGILHIPRFIANQYNSTQTASFHVDGPAMVDSQFYVGRLAGDGVLYINNRSVLPNVTFSVRSRNTVGADAAIMDVRKPDNTVVFQAMGNGVTTIGSALNIGGTPNSTYNAQIRATSNNAAITNQSNILIHTHNDITQTAGGFRILNVGSFTGSGDVGVFAPTTGTGTLHTLYLRPIINQTGTASGNIYGVHYNPTTTSVLGTHYAWYSEAGKMRISDLAGTGTRLVVANDLGELSTIALSEGGGGDSVADGNDFVDGIFWNSATGDLTLTRTGALSDLVENFDGRYLTSYTETDPIFGAHLVAGITGTDTSHWHSAYSWGNHALAGYLTSYTETDPVFLAHDAFDVTAALMANWTSGYNNQIVSAAFSGTTTKTLTLTQQDGGTITANFTDNNDGGGGGADGNDYVDGVSFAPATGNLTLTRTGALADLTANLDGRYASIFENFYITNDLTYDSLTHRLNDSVLVVKSLDVAAGSGISVTSTTTDTTQRYEISINRTYGGGVVLTGNEVTLGGTVDATKTININGGGAATALVFSKTASTDHLRFTGFSSASTPTVYTALDVSGNLVTRTLTQTQADLQVPDQTGDLINNSGFITNLNDYLDFTNAGPPADPSDGVTRLSFNTSGIMYWKNGTTGHRTTIDASAQTAARTITLPDLNSRTISVNEYARLFTLQTSANPTGTITSTVTSGGQHSITLTSTGGRTLAFSGHTTGHQSVLYFDNSSGATVALTLPSNSFVLDETGVYSSNTAVTLPTGKATLALVLYDGTNYWFNTSFVVPAP